MAYLPDLTAPRSWEPEAPQRRSRAFGVIVALFFALLLCAASAAATAVYLDGVHVDAQVALNDEPAAFGGDDGPAGAVPDDPKEAADQAWVAGRKAGYKKGVAAGKLQSEKARKQAYAKGMAEGRKAGAEAGTKAGYQQGWQDAAARYEQAWDSANPTPQTGTGAVNAPDASSPTP
jgi:hypothetical protein